MIDKNPADPPLSSEEIQRYARHIILPGIGGQGQQALKKAKILIVGMGGLGAPVAIYLAAAGVGMLGLVDDDDVSISNLQRQIIYLSHQVGTAKVQSAQSLLSQINPHTKINAHHVRVNKLNAFELIAQYDVIVDGSDNFATRYLVSDACFFAQKPLVTGAVSQFDGSLTLLMPFVTGANNRPNPTYRCLFPSPPPPDTVASCEQAGIIGALTGIIGTMQAMEVIKLITHCGDMLVGRLMLYNALSPGMKIMNYGWDKTNPLNGEGETYNDLSHH